MRKTPLFRLFTTLLLAVTILSAVPHSVSAMGEIAGQVLATDITAYINGYPIPTYNIGGKLSVIVSDLRQYGFTTVYNDATRTSSVSLPNQIEAKSTITPLAVTKSAAAVGSFVMNVYKSDITVQVNGKMVPGFNVGGKMAMYFSDLAAFGTCAYDNDSRVSTLTIDTLPFNDKSLPTAQYDVPTGGDYLYHYLDKSDSRISKDFSIAHGEPFSYHIVNPTTSITQLVYSHALLPNTCYRVQVDVRTANCADSYGACIFTQNSSLSNANYSSPVNGTSDWTTLECLGFTDTDGALRVGYCLGTGSDVAKGEAWFSGLAIEEFHPYSESDFHFNVSDYGKADTVSLLNNPDNNLLFTISGDHLQITGKIVYEGLTELRLTCGLYKNDQKIISVSSGEAFSVELTIPPIPAGNLTSTNVTIPATTAGGEARSVEVAIPNRNMVMIDAKRAEDSEYTPYLSERLYIENNDSGFRFSSPPYLQTNLEYQKQWIDPVQYLNHDIPAEIRTLSDEIVGSETDAYKKILAIHRWVAQNISYDCDGFNGKYEIVSLPVNVLQTKKTVCSGYANLTQALIQAQGIPCMQTEALCTFSSIEPPFADASIPQIEKDHTYVEAYVNNRWVVMDPTWDSKNRFENGTFQKYPSTLIYFDITPEFLSFSHKILSRG